MSSSDEIDLDAKVPGMAAGLEGAQAPSEVTSGAGVNEIAGTMSTDALAANRAIAEGLASGALDPVAAQQLLIEQVLAEQLPPGVAPEQIERLRVELAALLESDPALANLLRP